MHKLKLTQVKPKLDFEIKPECSYQPNDFFVRNYGYVIDYDVKLSNGQSLQRDFVWTLEQKQELIMSIIKGIMLPRFSVVIYDHEGKGHSRSEKITFKIIDGKQRLSTIESFMKDEFSIVFEGTEYLYSDFEPDLQKQIWGCDLRFNIVYEYNDRRMSDENLVKWFELLNWAGTPQDKEHFINLQKSLK